METMMMPVIRISDATWERMKTHARPLEDTPEDIVRRALDALEGRSTKSERPVRQGRPKAKDTGKKLPQKEFREPLLIVLKRLGGSGSLDQVRSLIEPLVAAKLGRADREAVSNGDPRWWNATCWERSDMVKDGLLRSESPRGLWELSELGLLEAEALSRRQ
jgi:predicted transcriptional regulator